VSDEGWPDWGVEETHETEPDDAVDESDEGFVPDEDIEGEPVDLAEGHEDING